MNADLLKPGVHFMQGDKVLKSLAYPTMGHNEWEFLPGYQLDNDSRTPTPEALLAQVGWVFIAIDYRREQIIEIPAEWTRNGEDAVPDFEINTKNLIYRIDPALQLLNAAYLFKKRRGGRFIGVRWIDPAAIWPDNKSLTVDGYQQYIVRTTEGKKTIPAEDVIRFIIPGMREHDPGTTAGQATSLAAQILLGMAETSDSFYDTNGLPVVAVIVPEHTNEEDAKGIFKRFERRFRQRRSREGNKIIGLSGETKIEIISLLPKDLAMKDLEIGKREEILLAHRVPPAIVYSDVNTNQAADKKQQFVSVMGSRLQMMADTLNNDPDIKETGYQYMVRVQDHYSMRYDEATAAVGFVNYLRGLTPEAAAYRMGFSEDDFPEEMRGRVFLSAAVPESRQLINEPAMVGNEIRAVEIARLKSFVKNGTHLKRPFTSDVLTINEIERITGEEGAAHDAPFPGESYP